MFDLFVDVQGSGDDVMLLHGLGATHHSWFRTVYTLRNKYRCHSVDLAGFGDSWEPPKGFGHSMSEQADILINYLDARKIEEIRLIGHSMGGGISLHVIEKLADRGEADRMKGIVLVAPALLPNTFAQMLAIILRLTPFLPAKTVAETLLRQIYFEPDKVADLESYASAFAVNFTAKRSNSMSSHAASLSSKASFALNFEDYEVPIKLLWGDNDKVVYTRHNGRPIGDLLSADTETIEDCGHAPHEEHPIEVNGKILSFLDGL